MRKLPVSNGYLVETKAELPNFAEATELVADFETSSGDPKIASFNPWHHCSIAGLAIRAFDDNKTYYIPDEVLDRQWLKDTFTADKVWTNHNVKYDAHVMEVSGGHHFEGEFFDTMTGAKIVNSDRWSYSLDKLAKDWLKVPGKTTHLLKPYLDDKKSKDYGDVPADILGDYACDDVNLTLQLAKTVRRYMPEESEQVFKTERELTRLLFKLEAKGLAIRDKTYIQAETVLVLRELYQKIEPELNTLVKKKDFEPHNSDDCERVFVGEFGLPVLEYTDEGNPSFNKRVFQQYLAIPEDPEKPHHRVCELSLRWKELWQYHNLFLNTYLELGLLDHNGKNTIHPSYNQCVRTGRMSCRWPNMQQLNKRAKNLIVPRDDCMLVSIDYAQVEFRIIVHYIQNRYALEAYKSDPDTDFHTWVAEMVGIPRRPAKNVNFMLGYGGGKGKTLAMLQEQPDLMDEIRDTCDSDATFKFACKARANDVYQQYHETLPELKKVSNHASNVCRTRGYVRNVYGRRRQLPSKAAHKAFNTLCQSSAADLAKERAVALAEHVEETGAGLLAIVHDEFLLEVPKEVCTPEFLQGAVQVLESPNTQLRVPIRCGKPGVSAKSWADAS